MKTKHFLYLFLTLLLCFGTTARAQDIDDSYAIDSLDANNYVERRERIISFHSDILLGSNNMVEVTEHIKVYAMGDIFKHGIFRYIPDTRTDQYGHRKRLNIYLREVKCNGLDADWHQDDESSDFKIYIGDANTYLQEGEYEYLIRYSAPGHIGVFDDHDEIYWNVNGFDWSVPFDSLSTTVTIPGGTKFTEHIAYTGESGAKGEDYFSKQTSDNTVTFYASRPFISGENMTIAVSFTKGSQKALTWWEIWGDDVILWSLFAIFTLFCLITWICEGIDPKKPTVIPQYTVPKGLSPALAGRIMDATDTKQLMATILSMVVNGGATINRVSEKIFRLDKGQNDKLDSFAEVAFDKLFVKNALEHISTKDNEDEFADARTAVKDKTEAEYGNGKIYEYNSGYVLIAALIFIGSGITAFCLEPTDDTFWYSGIGAILVAIWHFSVIGKYTIGGIKTLSEVEGLKMYIKTAEELRMKEMTPEHFEELLPYAMAFGLENKWCKQFEKILAACNYKPDWYDSADTNYGVSTLLYNGGMNSMMDNFTKQTKSSIQSYDTAHSESGGSWSSGGGGGGFSGGGGGGGGGGGW